MRKRSDWFTKAKLYMVEIATLISIGMMLVWCLWNEFHRLFR